MGETSCPNRGWQDNLQRQEREERTEPGTCQQAVSRKSHRTLREAEVDTPGRNCRSLIRDAERKADVEAG
jgi:hypothetical protein